MRPEAWSDAYSELSILEVEWSGDGAEVEYEPDDTWQDVVDRLQDHHGGRVKLAASSHEATEGGSNSLPIAPSFDVDGELLPKTLEMEFGEPTVEGAIKDDDVLRVMRRKRDELLPCYVRHAVREEGELRDVMTFYAVISPEGELISFSTESPTFEDDGIERCLQKRMRDWSFPEPAGSGVVRVHLPVEVQR